MNKNNHKCLIGVQGSVMGWDDPWHYRLCSKYMRTGERQYFPSQDATPKPEEFISFIKEMGINFYNHQIMPDNDEILSFMDSIKKLDMPYFIGNEYGTINMVNDSKCNRYDAPMRCIKKAKEDKGFLGFIYDETEHLQLHPDIYAGNAAPHANFTGDYYQWTPTQGKNLEQIENDIVEAVQERVQAYGKEVPLYSEQVFPVMYHTLARGGMNPCPKVMKEEFQSLQLSTALGAAKQYGRKMGICVDLWGPDAGNWFTRLWGFPGHSPVEYKSALEMAYLMGPNMMFTENIDPLATYKDGRFAKTEFGDVFEQFIKEFVPANPLYYNHSMVDPDILVIRSDDTDWRDLGGFDERGLYGSKELKGNYKTQSVFRVFHLLSRKTIPAEGLAYFLPQFSFPAGAYERNLETLSKLPLEKGVGVTDNQYSHTLFYPMNNVIVLDEKANDRVMGNPNLIFICGSRITDQCLKAVSNRVENGAVCVVAEWLLPEGFIPPQPKGSGKWIVTRDFLSGDVLEQISGYLGKQGCWIQRFGQYEVKFYNTSGDGITLEHEVHKVI